MKQIRIIGFLLFILTVNSSSAQQLRSYKGQALFIYNFTKHIKWQLNAPVFNIGILGKSDVFIELSNNLKGKVVDSRTMEVKALNSLEEASQCQIVYLPTSRSKDLPSLLALAGAKGILIITEDDLASKGAGISFLLVEDKLRFKINEEVLVKNGLQVSGGLLSLAVKI